MKADEDYLMLKNSSDAWTALDIIISNPSKYDLSYVTSGNGCHFRVLQRNTGRIIGEGKTVLLAITDLLERIK